MKKVLNASEMKQVRGGAVSSSMCGEGEQLYSCSTSWMGGSITSGSVCAKSAHAAQRLVSNAHSGQGTGSDEVVVICS